jgi:hypothetical protein
LEIIEEQPTKSPRGLAIPLVAWAVIAGLCYGIPAIMPIELATTPHAVFFTILVFGTVTGVLPGLVGWTIMGLLILVGVRPGVAVGVGMTVGFGGAAVGVAMLIAVKLKILSDFLGS